MLRDLIRANFRGAILSTSVFTETHLRGADFRRADLHGAVFNSADLQGADLRGTDLRGTDLRGTDLLRIKFNSLTNFAGAFLEHAIFENDEQKQVILRLANPEAENSSSLDDSER
jgi:uncharacterized protein YjbI with pentapeptide repeats